MSPLVAAARRLRAQPRRVRRAVTSLPAAKSSSPFLDADQRAQQPDQNRDTLVETLAKDPAPIGEVLGAVGYHYEQWAHVSAYAQGIGVRTRDNPDFTMLDDDSLKPLWSVAGGDEAVDVRRRATSRYLVATMPKDTDPDLVALDADNGHRRWCAHLGGGRGARGRPVRHADPRRPGRRGARPGGRRRERIVRLSGTRRLAGLGAQDRRGRRRLPRRPGRRHAARGRDGRSSSCSTRPRWPSGRRDRVGGPRREGRLDDLEADEPAQSTSTWSAPIREPASRSCRSGATATKTARLTAIDRDGHDVWSAVPSPGSRSTPRCERAGPGAGREPVVGVRPGRRAPAVAPERAREAAVPALRFRARQHPAARRRPRADRGYDGPAHARPAHGRDDRRPPCRPTGSTRPTGPTRWPSPTTS